MIFHKNSRIVVYLCGVLALFKFYVQCADNLALYKPASQTGAYGGLTADRAVDGRYGWSDGYQGYCAHPDNRANDKKPAEWWVDLQDLYLVDNITIYNTYDLSGSLRMTKFVLSVGVTMDSRTDCNQPYPVTVSQGGNVTIQCDIRGRFVHFRRVNGTQPWLVTLCEVEVYGRKDIDCSRCPSGVHCDAFLGCTQCDPGKLPPDCVQDCPDGWYGLNCSSQCGRCRSGQDCNKISGLCALDEGCDLWYAGPRCDIEVVIPRRTNETIRIKQTTNSSIEVIWEEIRSLPSIEEDYYKYRVEYKRVNDNDYLTATTVLHKQHSTWNSATIGSLHYDSGYDIRVVPYREMDGQKVEEDVYGPVGASTKCGTPDPPTLSSVEVESDDTKKIRVEFESVSGLDAKCDNLTEVWIEYRAKGKGDWKKKIVNMTSTVYTLSPSGGGTYEVRVTVINNGNITSSSEVEMVSVKGSNNITVIVVTVVLIVAVIVAVVAFVVIYFRKNKLIFWKKMVKERPTIEVVHDDTPSVFMPPSPDVNKQTDNRPHLPRKPSVLKGETQVNKATFVEPEPVDVEAFDNYVKKKKRNMSIFGDEYKNLPGIDKSRCELAVTTMNKQKNRFNNIYAYDENRVILQKEKDTDGDYINANYITGYHGAKEYIATQGPKPNCVEDLWRMIWQENANRIVMLANLVDDGKKRCAQYWPDSEPLTLGRFTISLEHTQICADYKTRTLLVKKGNETRRVRHFHFTSWEDKNKPLNGAITLFAFYNKVHSVDRLSTGPMVVHCSAGVGRTGAFIAFDILVNQATHEKQVDVYGCIKRLRKERMLMVQTEKQYIFLHEALAEYLMCGKTAYACNNFVETLNTISKPSDDLGGIAEVDRQFNLLKALNAQADSISKDGLKETNKKKNRDLDIIPDDDNRPYLSTRCKQGNNYINAAFVPSYREHDYYIVTQMPLPDTIVDFWRLVKDMDCHTIVMLNELDHEDETCQPYWPDEDEPKQRYGPLEVELLGTNLENTSQNIATKDFRVLLASEKKNADVENGDIPGIVVRQFRLLSWPKGDKFPRNKSDLLDLFNQLQQWQDKQPKSEGMRKHCIIHCLNGAERSGMFVGSNYVVDKIKTDQEVDAFLAARYVAKKRPQFFDTKDKYMFLYEMAVAAMSQFHEYANV